MKLALRQLTKSPGFTVVAVLMLALGIGANTAVFSFVNAFFLQPLPFTRPQELVVLHTADERNPGIMPLSHPNFVDYRARQTAFTDVAFHWFAQARFTENTSTSALNGEIVSGNFFQLLGVKAALGRTFTPDEDTTEGAHPVIVVQHEFWKTRLGGDPAVLGRTLMLNQTPFTIIGVAPEGFRGVNLIYTPNFWITGAMFRSVLTGAGLEFFLSRRAVSVNVVGRLKPGVSLAQAQASLQPIAQDLAKTYPTDNAERSVRLMPLDQTLLNPNMRGNIVRAGALLLSLSGVILLIACANLANLLLARAAGRQREIVLRIALGAKRARVVKQLLLESALLTALGGLAGILVAHWMKDLLWLLRPSGFPPGFEATLDGRVLGFALLVSLATGLLFGLAPAWMSTNVDLIGVLKRETAGNSTRTPLFAFRHVLVAAQVSLSVVALVIAGLFVRSLHRANAIEPGWNPRGLAMISVDLAAAGYDVTRTHEYHERAIAKLKTLPGVLDASVANRQFFSGRGIQRTIRPQGADEALRTRGQLMMAASVAPSYLRFMGIPVVAGRDFTPADDASRPPVAIVNETLARRGWPGEDPLGKTLKLFNSETLVEVVGVVRDTLYHSLDGEPEPFAFFPVRQQFHPNTVLHVRTSGDPAALSPTLQKELQTLDPSVGFVGMRTMPENLRQVLWGPRTGALLMSAFGALALLLSALGVYAIMAHTVGQRTREIGIRVAVGAQRRDVIALILRRGLGITAAGLAIGLGLAYFAARYFQNFFIQVNPADPLTYLVIATLLGGVALLACYVPARRATRLDPLAALRSE